MDKTKKKKIILASIGTAAAGVLSYFGWQFLKNKKDEKAAKGNDKTSQSPSGGADSTRSNNPSDTTHRSSYSPASDSSFPLKKGSRGAKVKAFQQALIAKYGASILPKYGADGDFGNEMSAALNTEGLPSTIDQNTYNSLVQGSSGSGSMSNQQLADALYNAVESTDLSSALKALKQMNSVSDYEAVNKIFETNSIGFVSKTIVNGVLDAFSDENQKQQIRSEFTRMGLKYDGTKWSLSGIPGYQIITITPTTVCEKNGRKIKVGANIVLGHISGIQGEWAFFYPDNANVMLKVKRQFIKSYKPKQK